MLIYENALASSDDIRDFVLEGEAAVSFPLNRMRLESVKDPAEGQKSNFVFWCPAVFPPDIRIEWEFRPIREPGLCILFFAAQGKGGADLFSPTLTPRTGEYEMYHHGDMDAYHLSYFRRRWPEERAFHTCNLRKSYGFHLVTQGADPIPDVDDATRAYRLQLEKRNGNISFAVDGLTVLQWEDDGHTFGETLGQGRIGFRQMAPLIGEYANLKVYSV
ncbi:DUF1961 family protein [Paenibacillus allorhizosphaerae]|uniref:DUF1961 family protein n=1 Tax=Paenibacillus allorhizosphaerae TaxID=2849866 RepID=A0ABM8VGC8_9BACL|nr:DUF1961 family protein [Paenibacillus allorhizosphaerae]CAG7638024.1 putative protein YesU [Paenibacillus allorhizosphaerae]